jgi:hypothetical protein
VVNRGSRVAVVFLVTFVISEPGFAAENWPDSVDQYVAQGGPATQGYWLHQRYGRRDGVGRLAEEGVSVRQG